MDRHGILIRICTFRTNNICYILYLMAKKKQAFQWISTRITSTTFVMRNAFGKFVRVSVLEKKSNIRSIRKILFSRTIWMICKRNYHKLFTAVNWIGIHYRMIKFYIFLMYLYNNRTNNWTWNRFTAFAVKKRVSDIGWQDTKYIKIYKNSLAIVFTKKLRILHHKALF